MSAIRPNKEQFLDLMNAPDEGPVVMLNLLKFKPREGASEYNKYGDAVVKMVEASGGKVLWMGKVDQTLIGPVDEAWDSIALVQYPMSHGLPAVTVSMIHQLPDNWRIDVPDDRTGDQIYNDLLTHLTWLGDHKDQWPGDVNDGYRMFSHHVVSALYGVPMPQGGMGAAGANSQ